MDADYRAKSLKSQKIELKDFGSHPEDMILLIMEQAEDIGKETYKAMMRDDKFFRVSRRVYYDLLFSVN